MRNRNFILLFISILFLGTNHLLSQSIDEVLQKTKKVYSTDIELSMKMYFNLYLDNGNNISESFQAEYLKLNDDYYTKINRTEILVNNDIYIKVNHDQKLILVTKPLDETTNNSISKNFDIEFFNKLTDSKSLKKNKGSFVITLDLDSTNIYQFSKVIFIIDNKTYRITKQIFYFREKYFSQFNSDTKDNARLEIIYSDFNNTIISSEKILFMENHYLIHENGSIKPAKRLKNYTIVGS